MVKNTHHILWQARWWSKGYAKLLRLHPYLKVKIDRDGLHAKIHNQIADIPKPNSYLVKKAYVNLVGDYYNGVIGDNDTLEARIDYLLKFWTFEKCPYTYLAMMWQRKIITDYEKGG